MGRKRHSAFDLADEAWCLLRQAPVATLAWYYLPTTLFVFGFLFFFVEMTANPHAIRWVGSYSLGLALGYPVLRACQTLFCSRLYREITGRPALRCTPWTVLRLIWIHTTTSIAAVLLIPVSMGLVLPWSWHYAYHQHLLTWTRPKLEPSLAWHTRAWSLALTQSKQHTVFFFFQILARFFLFVVGLVLAGVLPGLLKSLFGLDTALSTSKWWLFNTSVWAILIGAVYLFMDPLVKAFFVLRAFYAESVRSGDDLRGELRQCRERRGLGAATAKGAVVLLVVAWGLSGGPPVAAQEVETRGGVGAVVWEGEADPEFDQSMEAALEKTSRRRHFSWRMELDPSWEGYDEEDDEVADRVAESLESLIRSFSEPVKELFAWLGRQFTNTGGGGTAPAMGPRSGKDWAEGLKTGAKGLLVVMGILMVILLYRSRKNLLPAAHGAPEDHFLEIPDLEDESLLATQLPEEDWLRIAEELRRKGEWRTALRALFLASLATLGRHELIRISRAKSNREYAREVHRKAHQIPVVYDEMVQGVRVFEQSWYGWVEADEGSFNTLRGHVERIRGGLHD